MRNIWNQFGLTSTPFFDQPLDPNEQGPYPITLYVSRGGEERILDRIASSANSVSVVESLPGGGKTTLINYVKYQAAKEQYLVSAGHVKVTSSFSAATFALETLFHLVQPLHVAKPERAAKSGPVEAARALIEGATSGGGWRVGVEGQAGVAPGAGMVGMGVSLGREKPSRLPGLVEHARLHTLVRQVAEEAQRLGYKGCVIHINNLELSAMAGETWPAQLFNDIRDDLQIPGVHYVIGASRGFIAEHLAKHTRVATILQHPIDLPRFERKQIRTVLEKRYEKLRLPPAGRHQEPTPPFKEPVTWDAVERMYQTFNGDLRALFSALEDAMELRRVVEAKPLEFAEAVALLKPAYADFVLRDLKGAQGTALNKMARMQLPFTQADLQRELKKSQPRVSQLMGELQARDVVVLVGGPKPLKYTLSGKAKIALGLEG